MSRRSRRPGNQCWLHDRRASDRLMCRKLSHKRDSRESCGFSAICPARRLAPTPVLTRSGGMQTCSQSVRICRRRAKGHAQLCSTELSIRYSTRGQYPRIADAVTQRPAPGRPRRPPHHNRPHHRLPPRQPSWRNWVGNQSSACRPKFVTASQEQDVVDAVREARRSGLRLRSPGTGHSFTGVARTDEFSLDTRAIERTFGDHAKARTATAKAHTTIAQFGAPLWDAGLALQNQGDIDTQTIAGAVGATRSEVEIERGVRQLFVHPDGLPVARRRGQCAASCRSKRRRRDGRSAMFIGMLGVMTSVDAAQSARRDLPDGSAFRARGRGLARPTGRDSVVILGLRQAGHQVIGPI